MGLGQFPEMTLVLASISVALVQNFAPVGIGLRTPHQTGVVFSLLIHAPVLCLPWQPACTGAGELEAQGLEVGGQCSPDVYLSSNLLIHPISLPHNRLGTLNN